LPGLDDHAEQTATHPVGTPTNVRGAPIQTMVVRVGRQKRVVRYHSAPLLMGLILVSRNKHNPFAYDNFRFVRQSSKKLTDTEKFRYQSRNRHRPDYKRHAGVDRRWGLPNFGQLTLLRVLLREAIR
jgi:hypothetical protein